jgi:hypothetical protein
MTMTKPSIKDIESMLNQAEIAVAGADLQQKWNKAGFQGEAVSGLGGQLEVAVFRLSGAYTSGCADELALPLVAVASRMFSHSPKLAEAAIDVCTQVFRTAPGYSPPVEAALDLMTNIGVTFAP